MRGRPGRLFTSRAIGNHRRRGRTEPVSPQLSVTARTPRSPLGRAVAVAAIALTLGCLFATTYTLALGNPVPHSIPAAFVGGPGVRAGAQETLERATRGGIVFRQFPSLAAARHAIDRQAVYAALDESARRPTLYVASAAGASVARVLEKAAASGGLRTVDTHPLPPSDPQGLDIFYLVLAATIVGFVTIFQIRANAAGLGLAEWTAFVVGFALTASIVLTILTGPVLHRLGLPQPESFGIVALQILTASTFCSTMVLLVNRWAIVPTWLLFVVLGNSSSGGAVAPPLLPRPFAIISQWLPSGAAVTAIRNAVYFRHDQHGRPIAVLAAWASAFFAAMLAVGHVRATSPGHTQPVRPPRDAGRLP